MTDRTKAPQIKAIGDFKLPIPDIEILPNGIPLNIIHGDAQEIVELSLLFTGGESEAKRRIVSRLMAVSMAEGTAGLTGAEISDILEYNGAKLNVLSGQHHTCVVLVMLPSRAANVIEVLKGILLNPSYEENAVATYKENAVKGFLQRRSKVMPLAVTAALGMIAGNDSPLVLEDDVDAIESITRKDLMEFHRQVISTGGCKAYLSGNVTPEVRTLSIDLLTSLPHKAGCPIRLSEFKLSAPALERIEKPEATQSAVVFALPAPKRTNPDYIPLRITIIALGGYFGSRLMKNIREEKGYTYGINSFLVGYPDGSYAMIGAQADPAYVGDLIDETKAELAKLASEPMGKDELERLRQYVAGQLLQTIDGPFAISEYYRTIESGGIPDGYFDMQAQTVRTFNSETAMAMARKYLDPSQMRIAVVGPL